MWVAFLKGSGGPEEVNFLRQLLGRGKSKEVKKWDG